MLKTLKCNYKMLNPQIVTGDNCLVTDENGKSYIDFESGVWCLPLGHNHKQVNKAIINQLNKISHVGYRYTTKVVDEAAEKVLDLLNFSGGKCVFLSSGSEAVEFGVQVARKVIEKPYFLCLHDYYLSAYGISATRNKEQWISLDLLDYHGNPNDFLKDIPFDKIGAFVFEPGNASGTAKLPPKVLIKEIEKRVKANNGIILVDEVTTGVGRTGKWFGFEHYEMKPDIVSFGKGIGNGYPVSVISLSKEIADRIESTDFVYAQSHQDDPLACAVVKEVLTVIESNQYIERSAEMGLVLERELETLAKKRSCIKEVRGIGLMYVIEFWSDENLNLEKIHQTLFDEGFIVGVKVPANVLRFYPPLTIEAEQINSMVLVLDEILK